MAVILKEGIFVVAAKRTPFLKMGRAFKDVHPSELFAAAAREAFSSCGLTPDAVDTVNVGQVYTISGSADGMLTPRHSALKSGVPYDKPVLGVNRLCGSGFQALVNSAQDILLGAAEISLAGGTENMSAIPFIVRGVRFGSPLGKGIVFEDHLKAGSVDSYCNLTMAQTAENLAEMYNLKREQADDFAFRSQMKWKAGYEAGAFEAEIAPVGVVVDNKQVTIVKDEHPRPDTTMESLSQLPVLFREGGIGTVGNSTGVNDGAAVLILASEKAVRKHNLTPLVRVTGWSVAGVEPRVMGLGPVPAIRQLLDAAGLKMDDVDMTEINEQFAAQALASVIELDVDQSKLNMNGGAIALGHPAGASGARIAAHLTHELRRRRLKRGIGSTCIGGGQGIAVLMETDILTGAAQVSLAGGTENMSGVPYVVRNARFGVPLGVKVPFEDVLTASSLDTSCNFTMPQTAENLAEKYGLQRLEVDQYALQSQQRWKAAHDQGVFKAEMAPVTVKVRKQEKVVEVDEHPRPETNSDMLSKLPVLFRKGGVVTAGNSSGVNDGAGAIILATDEAVKQHNLTPLVRLLGWSFVGVDPSVMGIGPVPAIQTLLQATGLKLDDIDLVEINEAFSAQTLACAKELGLDQSKLNVNGGAIAMGHPVGASGARITAHLAHELRRRGLKRGIGSACIGGGQGIALLLETV